MGLTLVEKLNRIFEKQANFDISGMCKPELVTVELAKELMDAYTGAGEWIRLYRAGYDTCVFDRTGSSGIVGMWTGRGKGKEHLKLYWDQYFPAEIEKMKRGEANEQSDQL